MEASARATEPGPGRDVSVSMERANSVAAVLLPLVLLLTLAPFVAAWGWEALREGFGSLLSLWLIPAMLAVVVVHEGLHALGFLLFSRAPRGAIHFGVDRATLSPFAGCRVPVTATSYRVAVLLPALLMGVLPWTLGMASGAGWLAIVGATMLVFAGGDLIVVWTIRGVPGRTRVLDHPSRVGCRVLDG